MKVRPHAARSQRLHPAQLLSRGIPRFVLPSRTSLAPKKEKKLA
jgi:hypothetical protein